MNFNPLAQFGGGFDSDDDDSSTPMMPPPSIVQQPQQQQSMAIPIMQANGRIIKQGFDADDSELSENENDTVPEPVQFTVKHIKQQRQSVLAFNSGVQPPNGQSDPKLQNEIIALNQKIQSLQVLLDKSRNKARQQAVDLEDAEDRVAQLETEAQELNDKVRQRDHAISNLEYELQRAQKKDIDTGLGSEKRDFSDKLKLFQSKIAMSSLDTTRKPPLRGHDPLQRSGSMSMESPQQNRTSLRSSTTESIPPVPPTPTTPLQETQTITVTNTVVDETKIRELEQQVASLRQDLDAKQHEINELRETAVTSHDYVSLGEEMTSYQSQVKSLQKQCVELESMLKVQQEAVQNERIALKEAKDEWYIEEQRLLGMIDDLHSSIQQTSVDVREYQDRIQHLQLQNEQTQLQLQTLRQQLSVAKARPTISLPPTPKNQPLSPTLEVDDEINQYPLQIQPQQQQDQQQQQNNDTVQQSPKQQPPTPLVVEEDPDSDSEIAPPPTTPRSSLSVKSQPPPTPTAVPTPTLPTYQEDEQPPQQLPPALPISSPPQNEPEPQQQSQQTTTPNDPNQSVEVYEENTDDGELLTKGLLTKLGIDSSNKPSSKRHFFALFATKTQYAEYYGTHVKAACELRWGKQESDYTTYPYGATVTNAYVSSQAIQYLRQQGTNGQTLAGMVRPEDVSRLLVMATVDGRYVLLMCRDSEKGTATGADRAIAWCDSVKHAIRTNAIAMGHNPDEIFAVYDEDLDEESSTPSINPQPIPLQMPPTLQINTQQPPPQQQQQQQQPTYQPRESTVGQLPPPTPTSLLQQQNRFSSPSSSSAGMNQTPVIQSTPSFGPAPSPAHFMTRPLVSPGINGSTTSSTPAIDAPLPPMRGTLTKFIHNGKSWHTKHFFLTSISGSIQWGDSPSKYKYREFVKSVLRGQDKDLRIDPKAMKKANFSYNPDLMFSVQTTGKTLYLMAPSEDSLNEWIDALERAIFNQSPQ